jgi:glycine dehydrogenase subunit 1
VVPGVSLAFKTPFFKEFAISVPGDVPQLLARLRTAGYHAGLPLGTWYPSHANGITVAVTEKRTKAEIDGLTAALKGAIGG